MTPHRTYISLLLLTLTPFLGAVSPDEVVYLWPDETPSSDRVSTERVVPRDDSVIRLTDVNCPSLNIFLSSGPDRPRPAVLVCPGGGYNILAYNHEGTEIASWLDTLGVSAFVLKYTVPQQREKALRDAQRAIRLMRNGAEKWGIDPNRIGVLGFSAGGHLSASVSNAWRQPVYDPIDAADAVSARPDFTVLVYPAYLYESGTFDLTTEMQVDEKTPPAFIVQTQDDRRHVASAVAYFTALTRVEVPAELHLFTKGGHGYGLRRSLNPVSQWPDLVADWMASLELLK